MTERSADNLKAAAMVLVALAVAGSLLALLAAEPATANAASRFKTTTKTFTTVEQIGISPSTGVGPATPYPSKLKVAGFKKGRIKDVDLTLGGYSHTEPKDIDVLLVSPTGKKALVMSDVGGTLAVRDISLFLKDEALAPLPEGNFPSGSDGFGTGGTYFPANYGTGDVFPFPAPNPGVSAFLSKFDGTNPNGIWELYVVDDVSGDYGQFAGWRLKIKAKVRR